MSQIVSGLLRKGITSKTMGGSLSDVNCAPDLVATYEQAVGGSGIFNPPGDAPYSNYTAQSRTQGITGITYAPGVAATTMTITFDITEPLIGAPWEYGDAASAKSLFGINTLQVAANMGGFHRMLSIATGGTTATMTGVTLTPFVQQLQVGFVTPKDRSMLSVDREYLYGYTAVQSYISTMTTATVAAGATVTGTSNVIDLPVVPKGFIVYATYSETDRSNPALSLPDVFLPAQSIQCSFMTKAGLLAGASRNQLYQNNVRSGVSYPAWAHNGDPLIGSSSVAPFPRGGGNILYIDTAGDLSLPDGISPGMAVRSQFAVDTFSCINPTDGNIVAPRLVVIALTDGLLSNMGGSSSVILGGISADASLASSSTVMRSDLARLGANGGYGGGFWDFLKKAASGLKQVAKVALPVAAQLAPEYAAPIAVAEKLVGGRRPRGGALLAGRAQPHRLESLMGRR